MITAIEPVESSMFKNNNISIGSMINDMAQKHLAALKYLFKRMIVQMWVERFELCEIICS